MRIGDRIAIMKDGQVVQVGTPDDILRNPANDYVRSFVRGVDLGCRVQGPRTSRESPSPWWLSMPIGARARR